MLAEQTTVRRVRIRAATADRTAVQRRASAWLAGLDLHSSRVGRTGILVIRRLTDRRPVGPTIDELADRAARPARGPVPSAANAVLFADRAELLACLAQDWCRGLLSNQWWWQALFPRVEPATVSKAWRDEPHAAPAALDRLARSGDLATFSSRLSSSETTQLAVQLASVFQVPEVLPIVERIIAGQSNGTMPAREEKLDAARPDAAARVPPRLPRHEPLAAAIDRYVPEIAELTGTVEARSFATIALLVHRAPLNRITSIVRELSVAADDVAGFDAPASVTTGAASPESTALESVAATPEVSSPYASEPILSLVSHASVVVEAGDVREACDAPPSPAPVRSLDLNAPLPGIVIESEFAGAFYLVNVAIALGYYGDFTQPLARGLDLSIWEFIARVSRRLVDTEAFDADALPGLLRHLMREDEPPGPEWDAWLDDHLPLIRTRLSAALGVDDEHVGRFVVQRRGRIRATQTQIEVVFDLAALPIEIRVSGLDRDPGFVPAAGLSIAFIYV